MGYNSFLYCNILCGICVYEHICLNPTSSEFISRSVLHPCAHYNQVLLSLAGAGASKVGRLFGWCGPLLSWEFRILHVITIHDEALSTYPINPYWYSQNTTVNSYSVCTSTIVNTLNDSQKLTMVSHAVQTCVYTLFSKYTFKNKYVYTCMLKRFL